MTVVQYGMNTPPCPQCDSVSTVKNGFIHTGKQRYLCRTCHRQFVLNPARAPILQDTQDQVEKLLSWAKRHPVGPARSSNGSPCGGFAVC